MKTKLVIFGITGDLGRHKLLPALEQIIKTGEFEDLSVIGVSRHDADICDLFNKCDEEDFWRKKLSMYKMNMGNLEDYKKFKQHVDLKEDEQLIIHMAVPPLVSSNIVELLGEAGINSDNVKILFEKPFGVDYQSAKELIEQTERYFSEDQIYRIDHYLAKEMAQNIVAFRGRNALFSDVWDNRSIESIEVRALQKIDIEGRGHFYEQTGALRDVVQGHLMQLLMLVLMDVPSDFEWSDMPDLRLKSLEQIDSAKPEKSIRGQYKGYRKEVENEDSLVETFVSLQLNSSQTRWQGVPLILTTGKALGDTKTEIKVKLKSHDGAKSNCLTFRIQPNEGIEIELFVKKPGYGRDLEPRHLKFDYPEGARLPDAYEQVIVDAIRSHKSLFTSGEEVLQSWRILQPLLDAWKKDDESLIFYEKGANFKSIKSC